jgi:hypothetical protein
MRSRLPLPAGRRLSAIILVVLACAPAASAEPSADDLRAQRDALAVQDRSLTRALGRAEVALASGRARLDQARAHHRVALDGLARRLTAVYVTPAPSPVIEVLTGGDLDAAQAGLDLLQAIGNRDRELVETYRASVAELRAAEAAMRRRKDRAVAARRRLGVARQFVSGQLAVAVRRERALAGETRAAAAPALTTGGGFSVPVPFGLPRADAAPTGSTRGLPISFLEGRNLPGEAPVDAQTGAPVDSEPVAPGPQTTRAYPGIGTVGPAAGVPVEGSLPTFTAVASWYGPGFTRARMAGGEPYDPAAYSAASRTLRLGTLLRIGYGGRVVTVRVNDRGPYVKGRDLELSQAAAAALGLPGIGTVTAQILPGYAGPTTRA